MRYMITFFALLIASPALADDTAYFVAQRPDGMSVVVANLKSKFIQRGVLPEDATDEDYHAYILANDGTCQQFTCVLMPEDWWPPFDRRLRNAWEKLPDVAQAGNFTDMGEPMRGIGINMGKAKGIWKEQMERAAIIEAGNLDAEISKADLNGDNQAKAQAQQKRNALNGIINRNQAAIDAATTPEQLMAVWPTELEARKPKAPDMADVQSRRNDRAKGLSR